MTNEKNKKRRYEKNPLTKIKKGDRWLPNFEPDKDVAIALIGFANNTGTSYQFVINNALRSYLITNKNK